jgi:PAS domain S-box-containing protein
MEVGEAMGSEAGDSRAGLTERSLPNEPERELQRLSRLYAALSLVNHAIVSRQSRPELFDSVCRALVEQGGFRMAWIGWNDAAARAIVPVAECGDEDGHVRAVRISTEDCPEGRGPTGTAFRERRPYICNDTAGEPSISPWRAAFERRRFRASAAFPIHEDGVVAGVLTVHADEVGFFQDKEIVLLTGAAADLSFALEDMIRDDERRRAEAAVLSEKAFSDTMLDSMPGVLYFYDRQGRFIRWNRNLESVSGYSRDEIAGMRPADFFDARTRADLGERIWEVFEKGESTFETLFVSKDGTATPYYFTGKRIVFDGGEHLVGMGVDISQRKRAERALLELNESLELKVAGRTAELQSALTRAEAADRIKSAFLASMSHELRTPLNSIIGFTGILLQGLAGPLNEEQLRQLGMVRGSARHLLELINDVLDISKIEAGQLEVRNKPFDVRASVERVVASVKPSAEKKGLSLEATVSPSLDRMMGDQRRFEQILYNLLGNAIKFTDQGGITLIADVVEADSPDAGGRGEAVRVRVSDTGIGIKPEDMATIFEPFRQVDAGLARLHEGTGLGLAICRKLAALLGGEITARSEWSKGSTFTVTLGLRSET